MARRPAAAAAAAAATGSPDELEAEFYAALRHGDIERLMAVWADDDEIVCVHPGGGRVIGAAAIRASFEAIFAAGGGIPLQTEQVHRLQQLGCALHHLVERVEVPGPQGAQQAWVLSTNLYVKTVQGWRLASHHASPGMPEALPPSSMGGGDTPSTLH